MPREIKPKMCRFCGKELTDKDPLSRRQCFDCSIQRMKRWHELQAEAKRKLDEEWGKGSR